MGGRILHQQLLDLHHCYHTIHALQWRRPKVPLSAMVDAINCKKLKRGQLHAPAATSVYRVDKIKQALRLAKANAERAQQRQERLANKKRKDIRFNQGDQVLLSTKYLRLPGEGLGRSGRRKLLPRYVGPYTILRIFNEASYELHLPDKMTCHPVFHASLLKKYCAGPFTSTPPPVTIFAGEPEWEVDEIIGHKEVLVNKGEGRKKGGSKAKATFFHVKWKGYGGEFETWEPEDYLRKAPEVVQQYWNRQEGIAVPRPK